ncbi:uncharacterized protein [Euphorbia lathyris]|uniref:uncharacterized protein n=1 Tax=Euphorbia lathyris TaxID=212925 RepID=UPI0033142DC8
MRVFIPKDWMDKLYSRTPHYNNFSRRYKLDYRGWGRASLKIHEEFPAEIGGQWKGNNVAAWKGWEIKVCHGFHFSTIGEMLAKVLGCAFLDADDFHSQSNKEKMQNGIPLSEEDRIPLSKGWFKGEHDWWKNCSTWVFFFVERIPRNSTIS